MWWFDVHCGACVCGGGSRFVLTRRSLQPACCIWGCIWSQICGGLVLKSFRLPPWRSVEKGQIAEQFSFCLIPKHLPRSSKTTKVWWESLLCTEIAQVARGRVPSDESVSFIPQNCPPESLCHCIPREASASARFDLLWPTFACFMDVISFN